VSRTLPSVPPARLAVLDRIRQGDRSVNALAASLEVSDNAVRLHLAALERDGLLRRGLVRSGKAGQPAAEYELTEAGEVALSSAYAPALSALSGALRDRLDPRAVRGVFADAGKRLAQEMPSHTSGSVAERAKSCAQLLESLGGSVSVDVSRGKATIVGAGCPLASAVRAEPLTCTMVEALLAEHADLRVVQKCEHGDKPCCRFELQSK